MHVMVRRGAGRKAESEKDKFKNAIIANCVKKILNARRIFDARNNREANNQRGGEEEEEEDDDYDDYDDGGGGCGEGRGRGRQVVGQMVDYGWLDDDAERGFLPALQSFFRFFVFQQHSVTPFLSN